MLTALVLLAAAVQPAEPSRVPALGRTAWIAATVEHSEWCPAGNVRLDLGTGRYELTRRAPRLVCRKALDRPVTTGMLDRKRLAAIREASSQVLADGFESRACRKGEPRETIIVSNGGTPVLVLTTGFATGSAPHDLGCWTEAATALHELLDETFTSTRRD